MVKISSFRLLLPMDEKHHCTLTVIVILLYSLLNGNLCEIRTNGCAQKHLLIVDDTLLNGCLNSPCCSDNWSEVEQPYLCIIALKDNQSKDCCYGNPKCRLEIKKSENKYILTLNEDPVCQQEIILRWFQDQDVSCMPSQIYNKTSDFLVNLENSKCTPKGVKNSKINASMMCADVPYDEVACKGKDSRKFILTMHSDGRNSCVTCDKPVKKPEANLTLPVATNDEVISAETAAEVMANLSSLLDLMGNATTASISMGSVKGIIMKIPPENPKDMGIAFSPNSDMNIVENEHVLKTAFTRSVHISKEASVKAINQNSSFVGVLLFTSMSQDEKKSIILNNEVLGVDMGTEISNLSDTIDIHYRNVSTEGAEVFCSSWNGNGKQPNWTTDGCQTKEINNSITCQCSHLTFFAILMSPPTRNLTSSDLLSLTYITSIGCGLSMFFLAMALFMYFLIRKSTKSQATTVLANLFTAMFFLNLTFLINEPIANLGNSGACVAMAAVMHYSMLATFTWFFIEALHLCLQLSNVPADSKHYMKKIFISGWVTPSLVVIAILATGKYNVIAVNTYNGNSVKMCWITDPNVHQGVNIGYYAVVFVFTFTVFIVVLRRILLLKPEMRKAKGRSSVKTNSLSILALLFMLGITWAFAFFSYGPLVIPSYYIFSILNSFQGFFLFIYYFNTSTIVGEDRDSIDGNKSSTATLNSYVKQ